MTHADEIARGERFAFGKNWSRFLAVLTETRIQRAEDSLRDFLGLPSLSGMDFLDVGCGSGLFSLAARRLGARVTSFDYDPESVACARELKRRYFRDDNDWHIEEGSALDPDYLRSLGHFDIVYSWGVLHHTGHMWDAIDYVQSSVRPGGLLFIAIYNDMGEESDRWRRLKQRFCSLPAGLRAPYVALTMLPYELKQLARDTMRLRPLDYVRSWTRYEADRGMSRWRDMVDWVGGYPYEVATPAAISAFLVKRGFSLAREECTRGLGCNQFLFRKSG